MTPLRTGLRLVLLALLGAVVPAFAAVQIPPSQWEMVPAQVVFDTPTVQTSSGPLPHTLRWMTTSPADPQSVPAGQQPAGRPPEAGQATGASTEQVGRQLPESQV